jgi:ankyrin repeat protein
MTPLMIAASADHIDAVKWLVERGARPELKSEHGLTAAEFAARGYHADIYDILTQGKSPARSSGMRLFMEGC